MIYWSEIAGYLIVLWNHEDKSFFLLGNKSDVPDDARIRIFFNKGPHFLDHLPTSCVKMKIEISPFDGFMMHKVSVLDFRSHEFAVFVFNQMRLF